MRREWREGGKGEMNGRNGNENEEFSEAPVR